MYSLVLWRRQFWRVLLHPPFVALPELTGWSRAILITVSSDTLADHVLRSEIGAYFTQPLDHRHIHRRQGVSSENQETYLVTLEAPNDGLHDRPRKTVLHARHQFVCRRDCVGINTYLHHQNHGPFASSCDRRLLENQR